MFDLGIQELIVIFIVALIVFGPKRLPELGRTIGKGLLELKKAFHGVKEQVDAEFDIINKSVDAAITSETEGNGKTENDQKKASQPTDDKDKREAGR